MATTTKKNFSEWKGSCRVVGFSTEQTAKLMLGEKIEHNGTLLFRRGINEIL